MKYLIGGFLVTVLIIGYFINQSNKADAERLKQAEITHQQKLKQDEINVAQAEKNLETQRIQIEKARELKAERDKLSSQRQIEVAGQPNKSGTSENKYSEEDWLSICKSTAGAAKVIMNSRQKGVAMTDMMDRVVAPAEPAIKDIVKAFVIEAYDKPRYSTPEYRLNAEKDFEDYAYLTCIKAR